MRVDFYHLVATPLERVLPSIAERVLAGGDRLLVVSGAAAQRDALDRLLWTYAADSFLPHGQTGTGDDERHPVLLADAMQAANGARHVALVDGRWREEALSFDRAFHFFDDEHIGAARAAWKELAALEGVERRYWKQNEAGRWEQAA